MKKYLLSFAVLVMAMTTVTSCSDDDDDTPSVPQRVTVTDGVYFLGEGNQYGGIAGTLAVLNPTTWEVTENAFNAVNGRVLGNTPNHALVYGSKLYIVVYGENRVEVVDKTTLQSLAQVSTTDMDTKKGIGPRKLVADGGKVFISTQGQAVLAIDTTSYALQDIYDVGLFSEGMAVGGGKLYVANSNYGTKDGKASISVVDLKTKAVTEIKDEKIINPQQVVYADGLLYFTDLGDYQDIPATLYKLEAGKLTKVTEGNMIAAVEGSKKIYIADAGYPKTGAEATYKVLDWRNGSLAELPITDKAEWPIALNVDPVSGNIYIASDPMAAEGSWADYAGFGYVNVYRPDGTLLQKKLAAGRHATTIVFSTAETMVKK